MTDQIHDIPLENIRPAPWNPPSRLDPALVQGLADSIAQEGQQSPALVRPRRDEGLESEPPVLYELVWGHRRYAALKLLAERTDSPRTLKAFVRVMTEEQAMISSGIENLQREGFSDLEEAQFFQIASERYGESAVKILSEKLSVSPRYIRKRIRLLELPAAALELWRSGTWHVGHLEQLLRLGDNGEAFDFLKKFDARRLPEMKVYELQDLVDRRAIPLHSGRFEKSECKICQKNTDCQHRLFGLEREKGAKCLDQKCFRAKQQAWLDLNWPTAKENHYGTRAAVLGDYETKIPGGTFSDWQHSGQPGEQCLACQDFATILFLAGRNNSLSTYRDKVCLGDPKCFAAITKEKKKTRQPDKMEEEDREGPRVSWHGEYYRQEFYQQELPGLMADLPADDPRRLQLALAAMVYSSRPDHAWFCRKLGVELHKEDWQTFATTSFPQLLDLAKTQSAMQAEIILGEALIRIALNKSRGYETSFRDPDRQALAEFLDIDFSLFRVTEEYLQKKTRAELLQFITKDSGLLQEELFQAAMIVIGCPTVEKLAQAKKGDLVHLILNCGVDLQGRLPKEIAINYP